MCAFCFLRWSLGEWLTSASAAPSCRVFASEGCCGSGHRRSPAHRYLVRDLRPGSDLVPELGNRGSAAAGANRRGPPEPARNVRASSASLQERPTVTLLPSTPEKAYPLTARAFATLTFDVGLRFRSAASLFLLQCEEKIQLPAQTAGSEVF